MTRTKLIKMIKKTKTFKMYTKKKSLNKSFYIY